MKITKNNSKSSVNKNAQGPVDSDEIKLNTAQNEGDVKDKQTQAQQNQDPDPILTGSDNAMGGPPPGLLLVAQVGPDLDPGVGGSVRIGCDEGPNECGRAMDRQMAAIIH